MEIDKAVEILNNAERPSDLRWFGGVGAGDVITELSRKIKLPIITTGKTLKLSNGTTKG